MNRILSEQDKSDEKIVKLVEEMNDISDSALWLYSARNYTLFLALVAQFAAQILSGII
ncbi:MAG TPA: hypothetical protein PK513_03285 [Alphaproteobacteria bacterium]|uniref:hypothetical protein n=1 Tax=Chelatococcus sp. TaxID=1953771 RepID=UPI0021FD5CBC|nr:hypothetical protein [Chelatococcus sp.]MCO5079986.1 hypothetical protein [Chelatococcus sp.]USO05495.1 MAG: hypothetical protein H6859_10235 [Rhodospirillales bacterium]HOO81507.1 hypothetical protein [Alphaproteobacteria bacterium]